MTRIFNFAAGPSAMPLPVLEQAASEMTDWHGVGYSILEMSHRSKEFMGIYRETVEMLRELYGIPEEYEVMKGHVENSIDIIRHLPSLDYVIPAVIGHHERYDGLGYPRRIEKQDIPISARILCIVDAFDAMVSERSYKEAYSVNHALKIIEEESGLQFDPELAHVFVKSIKNGLIKIKRTTSKVS